ncbi:MAG: hypothetical protein ABJA82_14440 [Myxococcales bacterium]
MRTPAALYRGAAAPPRPVALASRLAAPLGAAPAESLVLVEGSPLRVETLARAAKQAQGVVWAVQTREVAQWTPA